MKNLILIIILINFFSFILFFIDKKNAIKNEWRVPENTLLFFAFFGPFGAMTAMRMFRHKIRKLKFIGLVNVFILINVGLIVLIIKKLALS